MLIHWKVLKPLCKVLERILNDKKLMMISRLKNIFYQKHRLILATLLVLHTIITFVYVQHQPLTNDEADYIEYSKRWLKGKPDKILDVDDSKTL